MQTNGTAGKGMKILYVLPEYVREPVAGIRSFYCNMLPALAAAGCKVTVLVARRESIDENSFRDPSGVEVQYLRSDLLHKHDKIFQDSYMAGNVALAHYLPVGMAAHEQVMRGEGVDLVEVVDWPLYFLPWICLGAAVPVCVSLHSSLGQIRRFAPGVGDSMETQFIRLLECTAFAAAPNVHTNSNLNARYWEAMTGRKVDILLPYIPAAGQLREKSSNEKIGKIDPVNQSQADASGQREPAELATCGVLENRSAPKISYGAVFARLQNWKGTEVLAEALRLAPEVGVKWFGRDLPNVGRDGLYSDLLRQKYPDVVGRRFLHHGAIGEKMVPQAMRDAAFVCIPSVWDVFNLTVIEAMSLGCVVVCSNQAGAEMFIEDGVNGFLFDPANPAALAEKMKTAVELMPHARNALRAAARKTVSDRLDPETVLTRRIGYYSQVIARGPVNSRHDFLKEALTLRPLGKQIRRSLLLRLVGRLHRALEP